MVQTATHPNPQPDATDSGQSVCALMEGKGAYNAHATIPAAGSQSAIPIFRDAARAVHAAAAEPIVVADYGSSEGKNSLAPMRAAVGELRARFGPERPIYVAHIDLPGNDFKTLIELVGSSPDSYAAGDPFVFPSAAARSFYSSVFPRESVHLGWSSYAAVWLSRVPAPIPDHIVAMCSNETVRAAFDESGSFGLGEFFDHANAALRDLVDAGAIGAGEAARMALPVYPRSKQQLLAPFARENAFRGLTVEHCDMQILPDAAWLAFQSTHDRHALAREHALFFRVIFIPTLATALHERRTPDERSALADLLTDALERRLIDAPAPLPRFVATIALAKASDEELVK